MSSPFEDVKSKRAGFLSENEPDCLKINHVLRQGSLTLECFEGRTPLSVGGKGGQLGV